MADIQKYTVGGMVAREKIAMDIKCRRLSRKDIEALAADSTVKAAFFGSGYTEKIPPSQWNREYLDKLSFAVASEAFNRDYLLYLNEVAEYLSGRPGAGTFRKKHLLATGIVLILIVIMAFSLVLFAKKHFF